MKAPSTYSQRLDEKVIMLMLIVSIIALSFTAIQYKDSKQCKAFQFKVYANYYTVGHYVFFKATDISNAKKWEWNFGDKTAPDKTSGPITSHIYKSPGKYIITLTVNDQCRQYQNIVIKDVVKDSIPYVVPQVLWPADPVITGQTVMFRDITNGANRWEWYIGEGKESKRFVTRDVAFTFTSPGLVPVKLFVNGNIDAKQERIINVEKAIEQKSPLSNYTNPNRIRIPRRSDIDIKDRPDNESIFNQRHQKQAASPESQAPKLTKEYFLQMIRGVIDGKLGEADFEPYLCGNRNVRVSFNGDDISFPQCIERLQKVKKVKSLKASAYTDSGTNCILSISIVYERKTFLGF